MRIDEFVNECKSKILLLLFIKKLIKCEIYSFKILDDTFLLLKITYPISYSQYLKKI